MAVLVAVAGAALGSAIPAIGANLGFIIGSVLGNLLFPPPDVVTEGPRLGDVTVTSAAEGAPRTRAYGTIRIPGNLIWVDYDEEGRPFLEQRNEEKVGGKGLGGSQIQVTYEYFSTFAIAFGEGEAVDVLRIWGDGKLMYDKTGVNDQVAKEGLSFTFHGGTETQTADPLIVADKGENNTPAFRGTCYIVFDKLPLADFGNRIPNITAEIAFSTTGDNSSVVASTQDTGLSTSTVDDDVIAAHWPSGILYTAENGGARIRITNMNTMSEFRDVPTPTSPADSSHDLSENFKVLPSGRIFSTMSGGNTGTVVLVDQGSMSVIDEFGESSTTIGTTKNGGAGGLGNYAFGATQVDHYREWILHANQVGTNPGLQFTIFKVEDGKKISYVWDLPNAVGTAGIPSSREPFAVHDPFRSTATRAVFYGVTTHNGFGGAATVNTNILRITVDHWAAYDVAQDSWKGVEILSLQELTPAQLSPGDTQISDFRQVGVDPNDGNLIWLAVFPIAGSRLMKVNPESGAIVWSVSIPSDPNRLFIGHSNLEGNNTLGWMAGDSRGTMINRDTGAIVVNDELISSSPAGDQLWNGVPQAVLGGGSGTIASRKWYLNRAVGSSDTVAAIATDICEQVDFQSSDIDVTDLTSDTVPGFVISGTATARQAISQLAPLFNFDVVESDDKLVFRKRGDASARTITEDELGTLNEQEGEIIRSDRMQEVEIPRRLTLNYLDLDNDYGQGAQTRTLPIQPFPVTSSRHRININVTAALTAQEAKRAADRLLQSAFDERVNNRFVTSWKHLDLDPSDVVTIQLDSGFTALTRLTEISLGANFELEMQSLSEELGQYVSTATGQAGVGSLPRAIPSPIATNLVIWDAPLLRNADEVGGRSGAPLYFVAASVVPGSFRATSLFESLGSDEFDLVARATSAPAYGNVVTPLSDTVTPFQTDETSSMTVRIADGATRIASITKLQMLNGGNPAAIVEVDGTVEYIQFQTATDNGDGTFTFSTFLRGRRGTELNVGSHVVGAYFILLEAGPVEKVVRDVAELGLEIVYRAAPDGTQPEIAPGFGVTSNLSGLKPYAPVNVTGTVDGSNNVDLVWDRRDRLGAEGLADGVDDQPLSEDSELYEIDIFDAAGTNIVRTVTGLTSALYEYTAANQTTDGFTPPLSSLTLTVYQRSGQVGRGFGRKETLSLL